MSTVENDVRAAVTTASSNGQTGPNPWPERLSAWKKFSETTHTRGDNIEKRYEDARDADTVALAGTLDSNGRRKVNMFYSNTTILKESLFNSLPKPVVSRLHFGEWDNEVARVAATIVQRALTFEVKQAPYFTEAIKSAIQDRLVPGFGSVWVCFHPATQDEYTENGVLLKRGVPEHISVDIVYWKDLMWEPSRTWEAANWVGRKMHFTKDEAIERFGQEKINLIVGQERKAPVGTADSAINCDKVCVLQIWDKVKREVLHMSETGVVLETSPDPYLLTGFYPTPRPLIASPTTKKFLPLPDYYMAQDQYTQLDELYTRISLIIEAIKVAGVYDGSVAEIQRMLSGAENKLIPVDNFAMLAEKGGVAGAIGWYPVEQVAGVLNHLVSAFSFAKTQLYEITGMSDIVRGSSNQYETLGAQQIKAQFASVRLNGYQRDVAVFVRDTLRIMAELVVQLYSRDRLSQVCGKLPDEDQQYVDQALQLLQNDFLMQCSIDIESDSLTQADWGLEQQQRMAYVQALGGFIQSALPVAQQVPALAPLMMGIIKFASVGFRGAGELEGILDNAMDMLKQPAPTPPNPEAEKAKMEMEMDQRRFEMDQQERQQRMAFERERHEEDLRFQREKHQMEMQQAQQKFAFDMQKAGVEAQVKTEGDIIKAQGQAVAAAIKAESQPKEPGKEEN